MIRAVLDVNVLVSSLISPHGAPAQILDAWREDRFIVVISELLLKEFQRVATYPKLRRYGLTVARVERLTRDLRRFAILTLGRIEVRGAAPHPEDDKLLACASEGHADYLVTGDTGLLGLREHGVTLIVSPADFVRNLEQLRR